MRKYNDKMDFILRKKFNEFVKAWNFSEPTARDQEDELFEEFCAYYLLNDWERQNQPPNVYSTTSDGDDNGVDGYRLLVNGVLCRDVDDVERLERDNQKIVIEVALLQAKNNNDTTLASQGKFLSGVSAFLDDQEWDERDPEFSDCNTGLRDAHNAFVRGVQSSKLKERVKVVLYWAVSSQRNIDPNSMNSRVKRHVGDIQKKDHVDPFDITYFGADDLVSRVDSFNRENRCEIVVNHSHRYPELGGGSVKGFTGLIPVADFIKIIAPDGVLEKNIFEENVRDFIGVDTEANKAMGELLRDPDRRWQFALRNNGVTIVAEDLGGGFSEKWTLRNFQIVNGCQTSNVVFENRKFLENCPEVMVPIRVIGTENEELLDAIVTSTNSQNAIKPSDLSARSDLARRLVTECERHRDRHNIFFERRKGQFLRASVSNASVVNKDEFTRSFVASVQKLPHRAIGYWDEYAAGEDSIWNMVMPPELLYFSGVLSQYFDSLVRSRQIDARYRSVKYHALAYFVAQCYPAIQFRWDGEVLADEAHPRYSQVYSLLEGIAKDSIKKVTQREFLNTIVPFFDCVDRLGLSDLYGERVGDGPFSRTITKTVKFTTALNTSLSS